MCLLYVCTTTGLICFSVAPSVAADELLESMITGFFFFFARQASVSRWSARNAITSPSLK